MSQRREGDTKAEIRTVALELFTERGYDATSLREIAERLGITKAALYYHYKNKEDIVRSLIDTYIGAFDELIEWAKQQPRTLTTREEALDRWTAIVQDHGVGLMRFMQNNQQVVASMKTDRGNFGGRLTTLFECLDDSDAPVVERMRIRMAFLALHTAMMATRDIAVADSVLFAAAKQVSLEILHGTD